MNAVLTFDEEDRASWEYEVFFNDQPLRYVRSADCERGEVILYVTDRDQRPVRDQEGLPVVVALHGSVSMRLRIRWPVNFEGAS